MLVLLALTSGTATTTAASAAQARGAGSGLLVTFVARSCPTYTDITANRARNDIQESLRDLGADTPYRPGEAMNPAVEQASQPNCRPLENWTFTLGTGYRTRAVSGPWGSLSIVTGPFASPSIVTQASTPLLDDEGRPTGETIAGATTVELTPQQATLAARPSSLWAQGGTTEDPILNRQFPGEHGFGALRCALDDVNGDNVEWVGFPSGVRHVFCFAYYVTPPPTSGTIVISKVVRGGDAPSAESFPFTGNLSFNQNGAFALVAGPGKPAQQTFIRAQTHAGEAPWSAQEIVPPNWKLGALSCASQNGHSTTSADLGTATASITLAPEDTVTCTYVDEFVPPPGGLTIRKLTLGGTGRFTFAAAPPAGGAPTDAVAETHEQGLAVDADPSPLSLAPGAYRLSETSPADSAAGRWSLSSVNCDGQELAPTQPINVTINSGTPTVCTLTNTFTPSGAIVLRKTTVGGLATTGFVVSPLGGPALELHQSATTTHAGEPVTAKGDPSDDLPLGRYALQETTPEPAGNGHWELTSVQCDGRELPFADGQAVVELTAGAPRQTCTFTNTHRPGPAPEPVKPTTPTPDPDSRLSIAKHAVHPTVRVGEPALYVITVTNHGPDAAREVVVDDQPLGEVVLHSAKLTRGSCTQTLPSTCQLGTVPAGHTATIAIAVVPTKAGTLTNRAVLGSASLDPASGTAAAQATVEVRGAGQAPAGGSTEPTSTGPLPHFTG